ncbi:adenylosuccinate synthase [Aggregatilineales bacterium SYSU G02658]
MPVTILIGAQWGDEGKGRFVDWLAGSAQVVARYSGGDNAGHTVAVGQKVYKLHLIPSGVLHSEVVSIMGNGMVINPVNLVKEMDYLAGEGINITPETLRISTRAHVITPGHIALDKAREAQLGAGAIGTTLRGIGPAYFDKTGRTGIRMGDLLDVEVFADTMTAALERSNAQLAQMGAELVDVPAAVQAYVDAADRLRPFIQDTTLYINQRLQEGARVVSEGAQGTLLDVDHGTYPFVTSSSPTSGGALTGLGFGPTHVDRVIGVAKAFSTRVGGGPMPTEQQNEIGARLRGTGENFWDEYGTTTGRARRCGWLDVVMLRYAAMVNGFTELALTKLDVLSGFETLQLAVGYDVDGQHVTTPPSTTYQLARAVPIYETLHGWEADLTGVRSWGDLPVEARQYVSRISELLELPIRMLSVGPERTQLIQVS